MFRMSDIYDKFKDDNKPEKTPEKAPEKKPATPPGGQESTHIPAPQPRVKSFDSQKMDLTSATKKDLPVMFSVSEETRNLYNELCLKARRVYDPNAKLSKELVENLVPIVEKIAAVVEANPKELIKLSLDDYPKLNEYFYYHIANVTILSMELANGLGYEHKGMVEIGLAALLHDVGLLKFEDVIEAPKALTKLEYDSIKTHPSGGLEMLEKLGDSVTPVMRDVVYQEHERLDGSGYPQGLKGSQICEQAQVVGLVDVYEALTHQRPYMHKHKIEAIKSILGMKSAFDPKLIKVLIDRVGVFPVGVYVRLNTKEVGMVVENNMKLPFRPVVNILYDTEGRHLKEPKQLNLADNSVVFIEECTETPPHGK
jgi:HD-GYP domain-containing protein (c-di-GMP phosphodiesterase class II)